MSTAQPTKIDVLDTVPLKRALISVYDKTGLEELATGLHAAGVIHNNGRECAGCAWPESECECA